MKNKSTILCMWLCTIILMFFSFFSNYPYKLWWIFRFCFVITGQSSKIWLKQINWQQRILFLLVHYPLIFLLGWCEGISIYKLLLVEFCLFCIMEIILLWKWKINLFPWLFIWTTFPLVLYYLYLDLWGIACPWLLYFSLLSPIFWL
ncbi:MAG: hypothetical protein KBC30_06690 [Planctomycetes bacterium]|nr:hypothetical protein [Planctomycetota bacterium]